MKNLMIFVNPEKKFNEESKILVKVQIDNSLELGWSLDDIMLVTNFEYEYGGVKSILIDDEGYCSYCPIASKVTTIVLMFQKGMIKENELYWAHDFDAFQIEPITEDEIDLEGAELGLCDYGRMPKWAGGSLFFRSTARELFEKTKEVMDRLQTVDEMAYGELSKSDEYKDKLKKMNISYNFLSFNLRSCYFMAIKPIRVAHFHPLRRQRQTGIDKPLDFFKGDNKMKTPIISERLTNILERHGVL